MLRHVPATMKNTHLDTNSPFYRDRYKIPHFLGEIHTQAFLGRNM